MAYLPRGIAPELLLSQVKNTMPYLFDSPVGAELEAKYPPARVLRSEMARPRASEKMSHLEYFRLCLSCHYLTCATPVPTDVDNQIRLKLWPRELPVATALEMAGLVLESRDYDYSQVTERFARGAIGTPYEGEKLSGHVGEWFTLSAAAYCALGQYAEPEALALRERIFERISGEVERHSEIFGTLWKAGEGIMALKASAAIAHNCGDLDRVMEMWDLSVGDPLRLRFHGLTRTPYDPEKRLRFNGRLWVAGELYKCSIDGSAMSLENHRHLALRKARALRPHRELLIPTGPFFDDWGKRLVSILALPAGGPSEGTLEVVEALKQGAERMPKTFGYLRALRALSEAHSGLNSDHALKGLPQVRFEKRWNEEALRWLDEIPGRA